MDPLRYPMLCRVLGRVELPEDVVRAFKGLADAQRAAPESAMLAIQYHSPGVLGFAVEHTGDLTHRMTEMAQYGELGREYVLNKVQKVLRVLRNPYGFEREHQGNTRNNASSTHQDETQFRATLDGLLAAYAARHAELPVYNNLQWMARQAAVLLGRKEWDRAADLLDAVQRIAQDPVRYEAAASEVHRDAAGKILEYKPSMLARVLGTAYGKIQINGGLPVGVALYGEYDLPEGVEIPMQHTAEHDLPEGEWEEDEMNYRLNTADTVLYAVKDNKVIAHLGLRENMVEGVYIDPEFRGKEIAIEMYIRAVTDYGDIKADTFSQEPGGAGIWKALKRLEPHRVYLKSGVWTFYQDEQGH